MNNHQLHQQNPLQTTADCLIVGIHQGAPLSGIAKLVDSKSQGFIARLIKGEDFNGKEGSTHLLHEVMGVKANRVMLVGLGEKDSKSTTNTPAKNMKKAMSAIGIQLKSAKYLEIINTLATESHDASWAIMHGIITIERAMNVFPANRLKKEKPAAVKNIHWYIGTKDKKTAHESAINRGIGVAFGMEKMLLVANYPANVCTPSGFTDFAASYVKEVNKMTKSSSLSIKVLKPDELSKLGMHSFLGVAKGSKEPARLLELRYEGSKISSAKKTKKDPIVLVGKGVTFDSGGISLKASAEMDHMKWDMCGAANVLGALLACAKMKLAIDVVGITPLCENMPSGNASKPSDVVTTMSGLTVENLNTDAEGRLILCDALTYAQKKHKPRTLIDIATLTGACVVALGEIRLGLYSNDDDLSLALTESGEEMLDAAWAMPTDEEYLEGMKSNFADFANVSGRSAGSVTAAMFLSKFIEKGTRWAHLDIAGVAYKGSGPNKGATGRPLPLLMKYLMNEADSK